MSRTFFGPFNIVDVDELTINRHGKIFITLHDKKGDVIGGIIDFDILLKLTDRINTARTRFSLLMQEDQHTTSM